MFIGYKIVIILISVVLTQCSSLFTIDSHKSENAPIVIACVGDSITEGAYNALNETYPHLLQERFSRLKV
jgi:lysophospholipase L1-like esterase